MPTNLVTKAVERSTYVITVSFTDSAGVAVVPNTVTWTLIDTDGNIINGKEDEVLTPATSIDVVLSENDLVCPFGRDRSLIFTVEATYDSTEGSNLPLREQARFTVQNLRAVL